MSELENIIDLTLTEDNIIESMEGDDKSYLIIIESEKNSILLDSKTKIIPSKLKGKFLNKTIASYKNKCWQYIEQKKAE